MADTTTITDTEVTLSRADYDILLEAAEELADIKSVRAYLEDRSEGLPSEYVKRMIDGDSPLKLWRQFRGLSQTQLAQSSGVNRVQISNIENQEKTGSVRTLSRLARTLDICVDDLILDED